MKLSHKMIGGYVIIAIITALTGLTGITTANKLKKSYEHLALGEFPIHKTLSQLKFAGLRVVSSTSESVVMLSTKEEDLLLHGQTNSKLKGDTSFINELKLIDAAKTLFYKALGEYAGTVKIYDPDNLAHIETVEQLAAKLLETSFDLIVTKKIESSKEETTKAKETFENAEMAYLDYIDQLIDQKELHLENQLRNNISYYDRAFSLFLFLGSISLFIAFGFGILQAKSIAANLAKLTRKAKLIGHGQLDQPVEITSHDELAELADTFNQMAADLQETAAEKEKARERLQHYTVQLEKNSQELQEIVFVASHDLQEPMRKIITFSDRLMSQNQDGTIGKGSDDLLRRMMAASMKMRTLLDDLLEYSQLVSSKPSIRKVDLRILISRIADEFHEMFGHDVIEFLAISDLPLISCDEKMMKNLFYHLFENSIKFAQPGRKVAISFFAAITDGMQMITVEDNGQGFQQKYAERIFNMFEKLHNDSQYEGTGMGLALCRKIMEKHAGTISVTSQEGVGSKFLLLLPVLE
ncbi:MAG: HAMP domain-containing protein [Proteobacteria bacterium]|nr:HAMP domain-containing protein [Pseudomonadota bacterium]MBU1716595.1 HAMP domain-containing protein [Pseudomonadota bacterium]